MNRRDVHDVASDLIFCHIGSRFAHTDNIRTEIHMVEPVQLFICQVEQLAGAFIGNRCVVYQQVKTTEGFHSVINKLFHGFGLAEIRLENITLSAEILFDPLGQLIGSVLAVRIADCHIISGLRQCIGDTGSQSASSACYNCFFHVGFHILHLQPSLPKSLGFTAAHGIGFPSTGFPSGMHGIEIPPSIVTVSPVI